MTHKIVALGSAALALALAGTAQAQTRVSRPADQAVQTSGDIVVLDTITLRSSNGTGPLDGLAPTDSTTGTKTATPLRETPQAISVVGAKQIERQGAQTVGQALAYSGGIVTGTAGTQTRYDAVFIRGFGGFGSASLFADYLDGLNIMRDARMGTQIDPWLLERVEAFRGPSSVLFGSASPGGFVNMVSKQPVDTPLRRARLTFGNNNKVEQAVDFGGPVAGREDLSYRLTGAARRASGITDVQKDERLAVAGALRWQAGAATSVTFFGSLHRDPRQFNSVSPPRLAVLNPVRPRVPDKFFDGDAGWSGFERTQIHAGYELQHDFSDSMTLTQRVMYQKFKATTRELYVDEFASADPASTMLKRGGLFMKHDWDAVSTDTRLTAEATTGQVEHKLLFGVDARELRGNRAFARMRNVPDIDYLKPDYNQPITDPAITVRAKARIWQIGAYAQDQMKVGSLNLLAGVRHDWAGDYSDYTYLSDNSVESTHTRGQALTWRMGAVYELPGGWSPYASYSTSFELQSGRDFFKKPFDPTKGKQFEAGVKYQPREDLLMTLSAFDLRRTNVLTLDPDPKHLCDDSRCSVQTGEVRSRGVELEAQGDLGAGLSLAGSASLWDVQTSRSNDPKLLGKTPRAVPSIMGALWIERGFDAGPARGLTLGGGVRHVGKTWGDAANTIRVPAVTLLDASVTYDLGQRFPQYQGMMLTANARNLLDRVNIASCDDNTCSRGLRREVQVALDYRW